jgi:hypothetical protein
MIAATSMGLAFKLIGQLSRGEVKSPLEVG